MPSLPSSSRPLSTYTTYRYKYHRLCIGSVGNQNAKPELWRLVPKGIPNNMHGKCERCGAPFKLHGNRQKRCDTCRIPARLALANKQSKLYYQKNKERIRIRKKATEAKRQDHYRAMKRRGMARRRILARRLVLGHYSEGTYRCACCGENQYDFLEVDHINGAGTRENIQLFGRKATSGALYFWLLGNGFPSGYQILCSNCNKSKGKHGMCVHQRPSLPRDGRTAVLDSWLNQP